MHFRVFRVMQPSPLSNSRTFSSPEKETPYPLAVTPHSPPLWQPLIYFLSLWICLFWIFHTNGIRQVVVFVADFFASIMFPKFIHVVACLNTFFSLPNNIPLSIYTTFYLSVYQLMGIWIVFTFCYCELCHHEHSCTCFCVDICFQFSWLYI